MRTLLACWILWAVPVAAAEPFLEKTDLFEAGKDSYGLYRIPGIVVSAKGTLIAYCEARKNAGGDWGHIDLVLRRSTDGGKTWLPRQFLANPEILPGPFARNPAAVAQKLGKDGQTTFNNPVAIAAKSGAVHFLFNVEYGQCFYTKSTDDGAAFAKPVEMTKTFEAFRKVYPWKVIAVGPGHGIELKSGRLVVPVWLSTGDGGHAHRPSAVAVIYSDDQGANWVAGAFVCKHPEVVNPSETVVVELSDGKVMLNIRSESKEQRRLVSISDDGVSNWSRPVFDQKLVEPICMGSIVRHTAKDKSRILFANPDNPMGRQRKNVSVRLSYDDGKTWAATKSLEPGASGYSDLAVGPDGTIYCFYERGADDGMYRTRFLTVARFNLEWLTGGKDTTR